MRASESKICDSRLNVSFCSVFCGRDSITFVKREQFLLVLSFHKCSQFNLEVDLERELVLQENTKENMLKTAWRITCGSEVLQHHESNFDHSNTQNKPFSLKINQRMCWKSSARSDSQKLIVSHTKQNFTNSKPKSENPLQSPSDFQTALQ